MKLLFLGKPGVGKGTYAQLLMQHLGLPQISSGDLLREEVKKGSALGKKINSYMKEGTLVPDKIILELIEQRILEDDCSKGFILDGFPRTKDQAAQLDALFEIGHVLHFQADDEVIIERLSGRLVCPGCKTIFHRSGNKPKVEGKCDHCETVLIQREDDHPEVVKKRLENDARVSKPLVDHYSNKGVLVEIVINKPIDEIRDKVLSRVKDYLEGKVDSIGKIE